MGALMLVSNDTRRGRMQCPRRCKAEDTEMQGRIGVTVVDKAGFDALMASDPEVSADVVMEGDKAYFTQGRLATRARRAMVGDGAAVAPGAREKVNDDILPDGRLDVVVLCGADLKRHLARMIEAIDDGDDLAFPRFALAELEPHHVAVWCLTGRIAALRAAAKDAMAYARETNAKAMQRCERKGAKGYDKARESLANALGDLVANAKACDLETVKVAAVLAAFPGLTDPATREMWDGTYNGALRVARTTEGFSVAAVRNAFQTVAGAAVQAVQDARAATETAFADFAAVSAAPTALVDLGV